MKNEIVHVVSEDKELADIAVKINAEYELAEKASRKGIEHYRKVGELLLEAKAGMKHGKWLKWLKANVPFSQMHAWRYMELAKLNVTFNLEQAWEILCNGPPEGTEAHVSLNTGEHEWYTPPEYINAAKEVLGTIDLDPASSDKAQETVGAEIYYTKEDDGLSKDWSGKVWMNPPYQSGLIDQFTSKLAEHFVAKEVTEAIVLVNNATETDWFRKIAEIASSICFPSGRIKFLDKNGEPEGAPLQGQAVIYLGTKVKTFRQPFSQFGFIAEVMK